MLKKFKKVLVANRGEIAIRIFRACNELGIKSVGIYSKEDKYSLFRTKADESYLIGKDKGPIDAYLDIDGIIELAKEKNVDAIHPGYGFLAENPEFVRKCEENGITFIGPSAEIMERMGDKINSKKVANKVGVATMLDAMKLSKILEGKYVSTLDSAMGGINSNTSLNDYGVHVKTKEETNNYKNIVWATEIDNLITINENIATVKGYTSDDIKTEEKRNTTVGVVGGFPYGIFSSLQYLLS